MAKSPKEEDRMKAVFGTGVDGKVGEGCEEDKAAAAAEGQSADSGGGAALSLMDKFKDLSIFEENGGSVSAGGSILDVVLDKDQHKTRQNLYDVGEDFSPVALADGAFKYSKVVFYSDSGPTKQGDLYVTTTAVSLTTKDNEFVWDYTKIEKCMLLGAELLLTYMHEDIKLKFAVPAVAYGAAIAIRSSSEKANTSIEFTGLEVAEKSLNKAVAEEAAQKAEKADIGVAKLSELPDSSVWKEDKDRSESRVWTAGSAFGGVQPGQTHEVQQSAQAVAGGALERASGDTFELLEAAMAHSSGQGQLADTDVGPLK
ncbi:unnamed protein product [Vitrella brassicaformis CCMP3155]|uniref:Uncharacterized protein n=1 Tax=Vitrella brassicaformis (strain CCMP3155) TaxID=1169540 RepID=A0A0G4EID0_VITBC|nr:unnamed protein product [Vitrella brassicaformis CCMP3155]|eukprot:CEL95741.1 unnamed protein product [Vitrella brassicaformis CCMP3155]